MKKKYINKVALGILICVVYIIGIKIYSIAASSFEFDNIFLNTSLIYVNPYADKHERELYKKFKKEEANIKKEIKESDLAKERYYWGEWDYETNPSINKDTYTKEFMLLAEVARGFNKIASDVSKKESKHTIEYENIKNKLNELKNKTIELNPENKKSIEKYINKLIQISEESLKSNDVSELQLMPTIIECFAIDYENILMGNSINEELAKYLNL